MTVTKDIILFFDMDGTLVDTNFANFSAYKKAIASVLNENVDLHYISNRRFNRSEMKLTFPNLNEEIIDNVIKVKEGIYDEFIHLVIPIHETIEILKKYSKTNPTYLVTNCRKDRAIKTLNHLNIMDRFTDIFYRHLSLENKKTNKFEHALSALGIHPDVVIAFENEETEIADAINAGIKIINPKLV